MKQYLQLLQDILDKGTYKAPARENMPGTTSIFGYQMRFNLQEGFPLVTTKQMYWKGVVVELLWFLRGDTNIKFLVKKGVNIWNEDAYNYYLKKCKEQGLADPIAFEYFINIVSLQDSFLEKQFEQKYSFPNNYEFGDCGYQYGKVWRDWDPSYTQVETATNIEIDQIKNLIEGLKSNPEGRRHVVTAWDPAHDKDLALTWCHAMFQFNCRKIDNVTRAHWAVDNVKMHRNELMFDELENPGRTLEQQLDDHNIPKYYLDCQLYQRSADSVLGVPFNIASYALLTEIIAKMCNMIPGEFIHTFGDVHIYDNHMDGVREQLQREPKKLPKLSVNCDFADLEEFISKIVWTDFRLLGYESHPKLESETKLSTGLIK